MAQTLAQKAEARRREDVRIAKFFLEHQGDDPDSNIEIEWARRVLENEEKEC